MFLRMRNVSNKVVEEIKTHILRSITVSENCAVYDTMWKNTVEPGRAGHRRQYGACAPHDGYLGIQTTLTIRNPYCLSATTMVARTRLNDT